MGPFQDLILWSQPILLQHSLSLVELRDDAAPMLDANILPDPKSLTRPDPQAGEEGRLDPRSLAVPTLQGFILIVILVGFGGFPELGHLIGVPHNKDYSILGSILGSPCFGKLPFFFNFIT